MPITVTGNLTNRVVTQSFSNNGFQIESGAENQNQAQARGVAGRSNQQAQSQASAGTQGAFTSDHASSSVVGLFSDVCDFNIIPTRAATITSDGNWQTAGAAQVGAQASSGPNLAGQTAFLSSTGVPSLNVVTPVNNFPNPNPPFAFTSTGSASGGTTPSAAALLASIRGRRRGRRANAQVSASLAAQNTTARDHHAVLDGIVIYDQQGPIDPVTNTAPGTATFTIFSDIRNNRRGVINTAGNSQGQVQQRRPGSIQLGNNLGLATQGQFSTSTTSTIAVG